MTTRLAAVKGGRDFSRPVEAYSQARQLYFGGALRPGRRWAFGTGPVQAVPALRVEQRRIDGDYGGALLGDQVEDFSVAGYKLDKLQVAGSAQNRKPGGLPFGASRVDPQVHRLGVNVRDDDDGQAQTGDCGELAGGAQVEAIAQVAVHKAAHQVEDQQQECSGH